LLAGCRKRDDVNKYVVTFWRKKGV
jgi:hypothetical protein